MANYKKYSLAETHEQEANLSLLIDLHNERIEDGGWLGETDLEIMATLKKELIALIESL